MAPKWTACQPHKHRFGAKKYALSFNACEYFT
jgi:hypothetical protein